MFFNITLEVEVEVILKGNSVVLLKLAQKKKKKKLLEELLNGKLNLYLHFRHFMETESSPKPTIHCQSDTAIQ